MTTLSSCKTTQVGVACSSGGHPEGERLFRGRGFAVRLFVCLLAFSPGQAQTGKDGLRYPSGKIPFFENSTQIRVCSSPWTPAVECDVASTDTPAYQWKKASGYEIEAFKRTMPSLGWTDEMIDFRCLDWSDMMDALENSTGECDVAPAGLSPELETMERGVQYSDPSLLAGVSVMMRAQESSSRSIWYFFSAMTWQVWVALMVTAFAAGLVVWLMEVGSKSITSETRYVDTVVWDTVGRPVQMRDFRVGSVAGNMVGWFWSFAAFIVMSLYNAALTANMTIEQLNSLPQRIDDLSALRVGTWEPYAEWLLEYGIVAVPFEWESTEDERIMMDALVGGEIDALVIDEPSLRHLDAYNCSTVIVETIRPVGVQGQHTAFPANVSSDTVGAFNVALRQLLDEDQLTDLRDEFIYVEGLPCKSSAVNENFMRVTWNDVAGLWVMLGISIAFGLLMVTSYRLWNHWLSKTSLFRKPSSLAHGWSRHLESMADRNMSGKDFGGYSIERSMSGTSEHSAEVRDLVMALQKQVASVEALIKEQQRQGL